MRKRQKCGYAFKRKKILKLKFKIFNFKEYLRLVGIKSQAFWITWWLRLIANFILISILITIVTKISLSANSVAYRLLPEKIILEQTSSYLVFLFLCAYSTQVSTFVLLLAQLFNKRIRNLFCFYFFKLVINILI